MVLASDNINLEPSRMGYNVPVLSKECKAMEISSLLMDYGVFKTIHVEDWIDRGPAKLEEYLEKKYLPHSIVPEESTPVKYSLWREAVLPITFAAASAAVTFAALFTSSQIINLYQDTVNPSQTEQKDVHTSQDLEKLLEDKKPNVSDIQTGYHENYNQENN